MSQNKPVEAGNSGDNRVHLLPDVVPVAQVGDAWCTPQLYRCVGFQSRDVVGNLKAVKAGKKAVHQAGCRLRFA